jgi:hypothetical protein
MKSLSDIAKRFEGIQEVPENQGFKDKFLSYVMNVVGFEKGYAWCMLFANVCAVLYFTQFNSFLIQKFKDCFTPGAVSTFNRFKKHFPEMVSDKPSRNSIAIWQKYTNGKATWRGHAGVVVWLNGSVLLSVEGNTNKAGGRDGDGVYVKERNIYANSDNGLRLKGFINLPDGYA